MTVENRRHPRFAQQIDVQVLKYARQLDVDIDGLETYTTNVSLAGLQVECPGMRIQEIESAVKEGSLKLQIRIPGGEFVRAATRVTYTSPCGDDYLLGMQIISFEQNGAAHWQRYIESLDGSRPLK
jgi:hypothetical protein